MIISFSGTDGAGKSTQIEKLRKEIISDGFKSKSIWARGGYTPLMNGFKASILWILGKKGFVLDQSSSKSQTYSKRRHRILNYYLVSKVWLIFAIIDLALLYGVYVRWLSMMGTIVICDRYIWDTRLDFLRNFPKHFNENSFLWKFLVIFIPKPHLSVVIIVPAETTLKRSRQKNEPFPDTMETLTFRLIGYNERSEFFDKNTVRLEGVRPVEDIFSDICKAVHAANPKVFSK